MEAPSHLDRMPREVETALFRIVQESLSNVHRHSGSKTARIQLEQDEVEIRLEVSDQGRGFVAPVPNELDATRLGVGIAGMRERVRQLGGRLEIRSSSSGTTVIAMLPLLREHPKPGSDSAEKVLRELFGGMKDEGMPVALTKKEAA
jgi:signal transduction histidine kinase